MLEVDLEEHRSRLRQLLGAERVHSELSQLQAHQRDTWFLNVYRAFHGRLPSVPLAVVFPQTAEHVQEVVRYALSHRLPVVPYGGGSGVCGAIEPSTDAIVIDMRRMARIVEINEHALYTRVQAGKMGEAFEAELRAAGFTSGHFPQSIALSTIGGWLSTRAAGQYSTRYGNIEDLVLGFDVVLPDGRLLRFPPRTRWGSGPDLRQLFLGAEGTFGIFTEATLKIFPLPESTLLQSFAFADMATGLEAIRQIVRGGWRPAVVRLYDAIETARHFPESSSGSDCLLLLISEGAGALTAAEAAAAAGICAGLGAQPQGALPVQRWLEERNRVPTFESLIEKGLVVDTIEVSATWDSVARLYHDVVRALQRVPGMLLASGHSSHSYPQGTNIYFTFAARPPEPELGEQTYLDCWRAAMEATLQAGGSIVHHHGIGRIRKPWLGHELGEGVDLLRTLKLALDPAGIMNPGTLLPEP